MIKKTSFCVAFLSIVANVNALTLSEVAQHTVISNPEVLFNRAKSLSASQAIDVAKGAYYPEVNLTGGIGREKTESPTTRAIDGSNTNVLNRKETNIELVQNIYSGGALVAEVERNKYLYQAQRFKTLGVADDLSLDATDRFFKVILNEKLNAIAIANLEEHEYLLGMIRQRSTAGISRKAELEQAESRLALAKANRISAEANLREARISFTKVVGTWPRHLQWPAIPSSSVLPASLNKAIQKGLDSHPTLKSAYADVKEAKAQYKVAKAAYLPKLDLILSAGRNRDLDGLIGRNDDNLAMLRASYNVFRGGADQARIRETAFKVQEAYEVKNRSIIEMKEAIRLAWNAWIASGERIRPLNDHVTSAFKTRAAYKEQFKVGKRSLLDLLDSQNEYYQAQIDYETGKIDEVYSRYRILNGMGLLTTYLNIRVPINVVNNDVLTSHERINHVMLHGDIEAVPYPDVTENNLLMVNNEVKKHHPGMNKHQVKETTMPLMPVTEFRWIVVAASYKNNQLAIALRNRLRGYGMKSSIEKVEGFYRVLVGPYEYRAQAGKTMKRIKIKTGLDGIVKKVKLPLIPPATPDNNQPKVTSPNYITKTEPTKVLQTTNQPSLKADPVPTTLAKPVIERKPLSIATVRVAKAPAKPTVTVAAKTQLPPTDVATTKSATVDTKTAKAKTKSSWLAAKKVSTNAKPKSDVAKQTKPSFAKTVSAKIASLLARSTKSTAAKPNTTVNKAAATVAKAKPITANLETKSATINNVSSEAGKVTSKNQTPSANDGKKVAKTKTRSSWIAARKPAKKKASTSKITARKSTQATKMATVKVDLNSKVQAKSNKSIA